MPIAKKAYNTVIEMILMDFHPLTATKPLKTERLLNFELAWPLCYYIKLKLTDLSYGN